MSRYTKVKSTTIEIAYGYDQTTGYFFQVFDKRNGDPEMDHLVMDECSMFTKMSKARMIELMQMYDVDEEHVMMVVSDLPF